MHIASSRLNLSLCMCVALVAVVVMWLMQNRVAYGGVTVGTTEQQAALRKAQQARTAARQTLECLRATSATPGMEDVLTAASAKFCAAQEGVDRAMVHGYELLDTTGTVEGFCQEYLQHTTSQVWLVSSASTGGFPEAFAAEVVRCHRDDGLGLFVLGDNDPWFTDANRLLQLLFGGGVVRLTGNFLDNGYLMSGVDGFGDASGALAGPHGAPAGLYGAPRASIRGGFLKNTASRVTFGLPGQLHTGFTVAHVSFAASTGLTSVVETTQRASGPLVCTTATKVGSGTCGSLVVSGGFTALMVDFQAPGTCRFFVNIAAFLGMQPDTIGSSSSGEGEGGGGAAATEEEAEHASKDAKTGLCAADAFVGPCAVSQDVCLPWLPDSGSVHAGSEDCAKAAAAVTKYDVVWSECVKAFTFLPLLALPAAHAAWMKTDAAFNNPVAAGFRTVAAVSSFVFGGPYLRIAGWNDSGDKVSGLARLPYDCPFTTLPFCSLVPLVSLGSKPNMRRVANAASTAFLGTQMQSNCTPLLMLVGALFRHYVNLQAERAKDGAEEETLVTTRALEYMLRQLVANVQCAPDMMTAGTGLQLPLFTAFLQYCGASTTKFSLVQVVVLAQVVCLFGPRGLTDDERFLVKRMIRQTYVTEQVAAACAAAKHPDTTARQLFEHLATGLVGSTRDGMVDLTVAVPELPALRGGGGGGVGGANNCIDWAAVSRALGSEPVSPEVGTVFAAQLCGDAFQQWWYGAKQAFFLCKVSAALDRLLLNPATKLLFDCKEKAKVNEEDARAAIHEAVAGRLCPLDAVSDACVCPFASCFGPSVLKCYACALPFATLAEVRDVLRLKKSDIDAFSKKLRSTLIGHLHTHSQMVAKGSGACNPTTCGASMHRFVMNEMCKPANSAANGPPDVHRIADNVLRALYEDRQGTVALFPTRRRPFVVDAIQSYLRFRAAGAREPTLLPGSNAFHISFEDKMRAEVEACELMSAQAGSSADVGAGAVTCSSAGTAVSDGAGAADGQ